MLLDQEKGEQLTWLRYYISESGKYETVHTGYIGGKRSDCGGDVHGTHGGGIRRRHAGCRGYRGGRHCPIFRAR